MKKEKIASYVQTNTIERESMILEKKQEKL
jgi:hypothetical protein